MLTFISGLASATFIILAAGYIWHRVYCTILAGRLVNGQLEKERIANAQTEAFIEMMAKAVPIGVPDPAEVAWEATVAGDVKRKGQLN